MKKTTKRDTNVQSRKAEKIETENIESTPLADNIQKNPRLSDNEEEWDSKKFDELVNTACNIGMAFTQETISTYPQYLGDDSINVDDILDKRRKKDEKTKLQEGKRVIKKSKYLQSPYGENIENSGATTLEKNLVTYAWSGELNKYEVLYSAPPEKAILEVNRDDMMSLDKDKWVDSFVLDAWTNCLNHRQPANKITKMITRTLNYLDLENFRKDERTAEEALDYFIDTRLELFKLVDPRNIDPTSLEYIMGPYLSGTRGSHFVVFVVNIKNHKYEFLNSLNGVTVQSGADGETYKDVFDIWLREVQVYVTYLYKKNKIKMSFNFKDFTWESPQMPRQPDKNSCGIFCMKFLKEWEGYPFLMNSFKGWKNTGRAVKNNRVMNLRIQLCASIIRDNTNNGKNTIIEKAKSYIEKISGDM